MLYEPQDIEQYMARVQEAEDLGRGLELDPQTRSIRPVPSHRRERDPDDAMSMVAEDFRLGFDGPWPRISNTQSKTALTQGSPVPRVTSRPKGDSGDADTGWGMNGSVRQPLFCKGGQ